MKTKNFSKKLAINKTTIAYLQKEKQNFIKGGISDTPICNTGGHNCTGHTCPTCNEKECNTDDTWCDCNTFGDTCVPTLCYCT